MNIKNKIRRLLKLPNRRDFRTEAIKWVKQNMGDEYVQDFSDCYDTLNNGGTIGGFTTTATFLHQIEQIKQDIGWDEGE